MAQKKNPLPGRGLQKGMEKIRENKTQNYGKNILLFLKIYGIIKKYKKINLKLTQF